MQVRTGFLLSFVLTLACARAGDTHSPDPGSGTGTGTGTGTGNGPSYTAAGGATPPAPRVVTTTPASAGAHSEREAGYDSLSIAQFAALSGRLSDDGGYFDTDNLISNERSLLHAITEIRRADIHGGAYVGVGPDQSFNYIAHIAPDIAFVIDIRRDNLLQHLLFKALFAASRNRAEYLSLWLGRPVPSDVVAWNGRSIDSLISWAARTSATERSTRIALQTVAGRVRTFGITLSREDIAVIERLHKAFIADGVALRFTTFGRQPQPYYPTLGELLTERDLDGRQSGYLASDEAFSVVRSLQQRNLVIPVVGDLAGPTALPTLARVLREHHDSLSAFYTSNVEDYLIRDGRFPAFVRSLAALPRRSNAVIIRSWFGGAGSHPRSVAGYHTTQLVEPVAAMATDPATAQVRSYRQLVMRLR